MPGKVAADSVMVYARKESARPKSFRRAFTRTFLGNVLIQACGVITGMLAARLLGPAGRGELAAVFYYPSLLAQLGTLGLHQAIAYEASRSHADEGKILCAGFWTAVILGGLQLAIGVLLAGFLLPENMESLTRTLQWFMVFPLLFQCNSALLAVDQGNFRFGRYNVFASLPVLFYAVGTLTMWVWGTASIGSFAAWYAGGQAIALAIQLAWRAEGTRLPCWHTAVRLLRRGLVLHLPQLALILMARTDLFLVLYMFPANQVGLYAVAAAIAEGQIAASSAIAQVTFVKVAGQTHPAEGIASLLLQFRVAQLICLGISALFIVIAPYLVYYGMGPNFMDCLPTAYCLIFAIGMRGLAQILDNGLRAMGRAWIPAIGHLLALATIIVGAVTFFPGSKIFVMGAIMLVAMTLTTFISIGFIIRLEDVHLADFWGFRMSVFRILGSNLRNMGAQ